MGCVTKAGSILVLAGGKEVSKCPGNCETVIKVEVNRQTDDLYTGRMLFFSKEGILNHEIDQ
jgi:hypothetical protein